MDPNTNAHPTGRASHSAGGAWLPRLRSLTLILMVLVVATSGILGYQIGRSETTRLREALDRATRNRVFVASLAPMEDVPTTLFDRISLFGTVLNEQGQPLTDAAVTLKREGAPALNGDRGAFAFTELEQGGYTLSVLGANGEMAQAALTLGKTEKLDRTYLNQGEDGVWLLSSSPNVSSAVLLVTLRGGALALSLDQEEAIGLKAYQVWEKDTEVHIFTDRLGNNVVGTSEDGITIVAPGSGGSFIFAIDNPEPFPLECRITLTERNAGTPLLPMRYRLRADVLPRETDDEAPWLKTDEVIVPSDWIPAKTVRYYTLEWMWDPGDDSADTAIGSQKDYPNYRLWINVIQTIPLPDMLHV